MLSIRWRTTEDTVELVESVLIIIMKKIGLMTH